MFLRTPRYVFSCSQIAYVEFWPGEGHPAGTPLDCKAVVHLLPAEKLDGYSTMTKVFLNQAEADALAAAMQSAQ